MMTPDKVYWEARRRASFAGKALYRFLKHEVSLSYYYMRSNLDAAFLPFPIFTTASLLYRGAVTDEKLSTIAHALAFGFLYAYTIDVANNAAGSNMEDEINKPERPITSKATTAAATKVRYLISTTVWLIYSYFLNVHKWSLLWIFTVFISYFLRAAKVGPVKDLSMTLGTIAQLMACWEIGHSDPHTGWSWVKIIAIWVFFTVAIQDFRDVPGDRACGRWTMPILLGDIPARIYTSAGLIVFGYIYTAYWVLGYGHNLPAIIVSILVAALTVGLIFRIASLRTIESDRVSYRWYTSLYNLLLISACVSFGAK